MENNNHPKEIVAFVKKLFNLLNKVKIELNYNDKICNIHLTEELINFLDDNWCSTKGVKLGDFKSKFNSTDYELNDDNWDGFIPSVKISEIKFLTKRFELKADFPIKRRKDKNHLAYSYNNPYIRGTLGSIFVHENFGSILDEYIKLRAYKQVFYDLKCKLNKLDPQNHY
jgi:hypothetical protein